jgi:hypothetical protein
MEHCWIKHYKMIFTQLVRKYSPLKEANDSPPCSQHPALKPYNEAVQTRQNIHIHFCKIHFQIIPQLMGVSLSCSMLPATEDF